MTTYIIHVIGDDGTNYHYGPWRRQDSASVWALENLEPDIDAGEYEIIALTKTVEFEDGYDVRETPDDMSAMGFHDGIDYADPTANG